MVLQIHVLQTAPHASGILEATDLVIASMAYLCGLMIFSCFSLSTLGIAVASALSGGFMIGILYMHYGPRFSVLYLLISTVPLGIGFSLRAFITRVSHLVTESRKKDLLGKYVLRSLST